MAQYENYTANDDTAENFYGVYWRGQTFTVGTVGTDEDHTLNSIKVLVYITGSPGNTTLSIRATSAGLPTGADLDSKVLSANAWTTNSAGEWITFTFTGGYVLEAATQYAIVFAAPNGDSSNQVFWRLDSTSPAYTGGSKIDSADSGVNWAANTAHDLLFDVYGTKYIASIMKPNKYW